MAGGWRAKLDRIRDCVNQTKFASHITNIRGKSSEEELHFYDKDEG